MATFEFPILAPHIHQWDQRKTPRKATPLVKLLGWKPSLMYWVGKHVFPSDLYNYFGRPEYVLGDYLPVDFEGDTKDVELAGFVHVQAGWEARGPMGPVGETRWLESLGTPALKGIVAHADLALGEAVEPVLRAHVEASPRTRGIRYMLANHPDKALHSFEPKAQLSRDRTWRAGYALLAKHGLSFDAWVYHHQLDEIAELARDFPDVPVILCHGGTPVEYGGPFSTMKTSANERAQVEARWREGIECVAEQSNVVVKLSGLVMPCCGFGFHERDSVSVDELVDKLGPLISFLIESFGVERCMFASNFPVDKVAGSWSALFEAYARMVADRPLAERRALFHDNAVRVYRLEV